MGQTSTSRTGIIVPYYTKLLEQEMKNLSKKFITAKLDVCAKNAIERTPLFDAVEHGHAGAVTLLLEAGSDVNVVDVHGITVIHLAACKENGDLVGLVLGHGPDIEKETALGHTALEEACMAWNYEAIKMLKEAGAKDRLREALEDVGIDIEIFRLTNAVCCLSLR